MGFKLKLKYCIKTTRAQRRADRQEYRQLRDACLVLKKSVDDARSGLGRLAHKGQQNYNFACIRFYEDALENPADVFEAVPFMRSGYCPLFMPPYNERKCNNSECPMRAKNNEYCELLKQLKSQQQAVGNFWRRRMSQRLKGK